MHCAPASFLSNSQEAKTWDVYIMTRCSCFHPNNESRCPKGGKSDDKLRSAYYAHRNALGLFWTDFGESEPSRFASSSLLKLSPEKASEWAKQHPSVLLYVAHVSNPVWLEIVWPAIHFWSREHQLYLVYTYRQKPCLARPDSSWRFCILIMEFWS